MDIIPEGLHLRCYDVDAGKGGPAVDTALLYPLHVTCTAYVTWVAWCPYLVGQVCTPNLWARLARLTHWQYWKFGMGMGMGYGLFTYGGG